MSEATTGATRDETLGDAVRELTTEDFAALPPWARSLIVTRCAIRVWPFYALAVCDEKPGSEHVVNLASVTDILSILVLAPYGPFAAAAAADASVRANRAAVAALDARDARYTPYAYAYVCRAAAAAAEVSVRAARAIDAAYAAEVAIEVAAPFASDASAATARAAVEALNALAVPYTPYAYIHVSNVTRAAAVFRDHDYLRQRVSAGNECRRAGQPIAVQLLGLPLWDDSAFPEFLVGLDPKLGAWAESAKLPDTERGDFMAQVTHYEAMVAGKGFDYAGVRERAGRWLGALDIDVAALGLPSLEKFAALAAES
jgi:hypothetical protein